MITQKVKINGKWETVTGGISSGNSGITIVDNLNSSDSTAALSANQGRVLKEMIEELPSGGGGSITLDSEMSDTSTNAVSNKVIKEYVDKAAPRQFGDDFAEDFN